MLYEIVVTITFMMTWLCNTSCMINSPFTAMINKYHAWSIAYHSMINRFHAWSTAFHSMINRYHAWSIAYHSMINKFHTWSTWSMIMNDHCSLISYMINGVHRAMINYQTQWGKLLGKGACGKGSDCPGEEVYMTTVILLFLQKPFSNRYLTPSATSTAVERLFSAAGMIMEAKRNKLSPMYVDK